MAEVSPPGSADRSCNFLTNEADVTSQTHQGKSFDWNNVQLYAILVCIKANRKPGERQKQTKTRTCASFGFAAVLCSTQNAL